MRRTAILSMCSLLLLAPAALGQWIDTPGPHTYTEDKVHIGGTTEPSVALQVTGDAATSGSLTAAEVVVAPWATNGAAPARVLAAVPHWAGLSQNARYVYPTGWDLDDDNKPGWFLKLDSRTGQDRFAIWRVPPGAGLHTDEQELLAVTAAGNVGIGGVMSNRKLNILSQTNGVSALFAQTTNTHAANVQLYDTASTGQSLQNVAAGVTNSGTATGQRAAAMVMGAGTLTGATALFADVAVAADHAGTITNAMGVYSKITRNNLGTITNGYGVYVGNVEATNAWGIYQGASDDVNYFAGKVRIGTTAATNATLEVAGSVNVSGSITGATVIGATYQDLAEWVPASNDMDPATVVVLNRERSNEVMPSTKAYDTTVAGVVSAQPGIILGVAGETKEQIATTGRVRVRVDARRAPIEIGDLLVTSDVPGTAMRSEPLEIRGRTFHQPGTIIGKALEPLASGTGEILVLLSLQ